MSSKYNPFNAGDPNAGNYKVRDLNLPMGVDWSRMDHRRSLLSLVDDEFRRLDTTGMSESMDSYYQTAFRLMHSALAKQAFQIENEPETVRDRYGRTSLGQGVLLGPPACGSRRALRDRLARLQRLRPPPHDLSALAERLPARTRPHVLGPAWKTSISAACSTARS